MCARCGPMAVRCVGEATATVKRHHQMVREFITVSPGDWHTCALRSDGTPICWGHATSRESSSRLSAAAKEHTCALRADGSAVCWGGDNTWGQTSVPEGEQFVAISSGHEHTCALKEDGSPVCWGRIDAPPPNLIVAPQFQRSQHTPAHASSTATPVPTSKEKDALRTMLRLRRND